MGVTKGRHRTRPLDTGLAVLTVLLAGMVVALELTILMMIS